MILRITNRMVVIMPENMVDNNKKVAPGQCILLNVKQVSNDIIVSPKNI